MSGGSLDYCCYRVRDVADLLATSTNELHKAFGEHLLEVADALKDLEWELSYDTAGGDADKAIKKVLGIKNEKTL